MDFGDIGEAATAVRTEALISKARKAAQTKLAVTGYCLNPRCEDDCGDKPFCCPECRDEYDYLKKRKT